MSMNRDIKRVAVIAAHPDDEILGCGGTITRMTHEGKDAYVLILGQGIAARGTSGDALDRSLKKLRICGQKANKAIGAHKVVFLDFPDNRFDSVPLLDITMAVENFIAFVKPDEIFTHSRQDLNIDHRICADAVMVATRPMPGNSVCNVYAFEVLSSSEWNFGETFSPNMFVDISAHIDVKKKAISEYVSEIRKYPHPRSLKGVEVLAAYRGIQSGFHYAEAFALVRSIR